MRRFNPNVPTGDWPFLNRILNLLFNSTLPKIGADTVVVKSDIVSLKSDAKYLSDSVNIIDGGDSDHPL